MVYNVIPIMSQELVLASHWEISLLKPHQKLMPTNGLCSRAQLDNTCSPYLPYKPIYPDVDNRLSTHLTTILPKS